MARAQHRQAGLFLEPSEHHHDLPGRRRIEMCCDLVREQHLGLRRQRPRDRHPLPLPAGEPVGPTAQQLRLQPDARQQLLSSLRTLPARYSGTAQSLLDLAPYAPRRMQCAARILRDQLQGASLINRPPGHSARPALSDAGERMQERRLPRS